MEYFGVAFLQNKMCVLGLIPKSANAFGWNAQSSNCKNDILQVLALTKKLNSSLATHFNEQHM